MDTVTKQKPSPTGCRVVDLAQHLAGGKQPDLRIREQSAVWASTCVEVPGRLAVEWK
jgi:hypothetical protein